MYLMRNYLPYLFMFTAAQAWSPAYASETGGGDRLTAHGLTRGGLCQAVTPKRKIASIAGEVFGNRAACFMRIFDQESGAQPTCLQPKGHARNPHEGYGLCTMERSAALRKRRGGACARNIDGGTDEGIKNQMLCCQQLKGQKHHYFGKYTRRAAGKNKC